MSKAGVLRLRIISGSNLPAVDSGSCDPFLEARIVRPDGKILCSSRTKVLRRTQDPVWNEVLSLHCTEDATLELHVYDSNRFRRDTSVLNVPLGRLGELELGPEKRVAEQDGVRLVYSAEVFPKVSMAMLTSLIHSQKLDLGSICSGARDLALYYSKTLGTLAEEYASAFERIGNILQSQAWKTALDAEFEALDSDRNGMLSFDEIFPRNAHVWFSDVAQRSGMDFFESLPPAPRQPCADQALLRQQWRVYDVDHSDTLSKTEFKNFVTSIALWHLTCGFMASRARSECQIGEAELRAIWRRFEKFDADLSCTMDATELGDLLEEMGETYGADELQIIYDDMDADHDGVLDVVEFCRWWCSIPV